jgi:hypothetical protein
MIAHRAARQIYEWSDSGICIRLQHTEEQMPES